MKIINEVNQYLDNNRELKYYLKDKQEFEDRDEVNLLFKTIDSPIACSQFVKLLANYHSDVIGVYKDCIVLNLC